MLLFSYYFLKGSGT